MPQAPRPQTPQRPQSRGPAPQRQGVPSRGASPRQNPQGRPAPGQPAPQRRPLSPEEQRRRAMARREAEMRLRAERERERRLRKFRRRRLFALSFVLALVIVGIYWAVLFASLNRTAAPDGAYPVQVFTEGERKADQTLSVEETNFSGVTYIPLTVLQKYVPVTQYGDHLTRSIQFSGGDVASFTLGTPNCVINGVRGSLEAPVFLKDDVLYLPADFFSRRMTCFEYTYSSPLSANVLTYLDGVAPALLCREMTASPRIAQESIPAAPESAPTA